MTSNEIARIEGAMPEPYRAPGVPTIAGTRPRLPEVGRIRLGDEKVDPKRPGAKLGTLRFTSRDRSLIERVAEVYGGQPKPWNSDEGPQWQVVTEAPSIPVVVPRAELAFTQFYELWSGGGCQRRCNGEREYIGDRPCVCPADERERAEMAQVGKACKPTTRLSVMLPGIRGMGLWRVESHGDNARAELLGSIEAVMLDGMPLVPATLTLTWRTGRQPDKKKPGEFVKVRYVVPILNVGSDVGEVMERVRSNAAREMGLLPSGADHATPETMRKLRAAVFSLWPESAKEGPERDRRLRQLSHMLGRDVPTISNEHDLTESEARRLTSEVNELHEDPEISAGDGGATEGTTNPGNRGESSIASPAEHHPQGSAGAIIHSDVARDTPGASEEAAPAEHHTAEEDGEASPADGTVPGGPDRSDTGQPSGPAPTQAAAPPRSKRAQVYEDRTWPEGNELKPPAAPARRPRTATTEDVRAAQKTLAERKNRPPATIEHETTDPLQLMDPAFRVPFLEHFDGNTEVARKVAGLEVARLTRLAQWTGEWTLEQYEALAAKTFERKVQ